MHPVGRNNPCGEKEEARDCIWLTEIIPVEEKSKLEMHPADRNNPCGTKEQDGDESNRLK